jgi:RHS repeat-associated protein
VVSVTTAERQLVWGLRCIDDPVIRDRSTANNGTINERRYAMQDGNWNKQASTPTDEGGCSASAVETATRCTICDTTGSVGDRYAYSAYGAPVFMTGAGVVQSASAIGFETLYAGYRWDNPAPQMYYVRNRFLLPQVGTWNKRDPLGYVASWPNLLSYASTSPMDSVDPSGLLDRPVHTDPLDNSARACILRLLNNDDYAELDFDSACNYWLSQHPGARTECRRYFWKSNFPPRVTIAQGCVGVTQCFVGRPIYQNIRTDFKACYNTLDAAKKAQNRWNKEGRCSKFKNVDGDPSRAVIFAYRWDESSIKLLAGQTARVTCDICGLITWNDTVPTRVCSFDFGFYDEDMDCFWHATSSERAGGKIRVDTPDNFVGDDRSTVYCVTCEGNAILY